MSMSTDEWRLKCEAVARGEVKAKVKSCPKAKPKATGPKVKPKATAPPPATWAEAVAFIQKRDKCSASEAGRKACDEFKHLHPANRKRAH